MSSKTHFVPGVKTALAPRPRAVILITVALLLLCAVLFWTPTPKAHLVVNGRQFTLEVADNEKAREQGLGGRPSLDASEGMLFSYDNEAIRCIWMRDMHFSLDIIWLDGAKKIVHIEQNVSPATYPHQFCPPEPAQYMIEFNAGTTRRDYIYTGQTLHF